MKLKKDFDYVKLQLGLTLDEVTDDDTRRRNKRAEIKDSRYKC